MTPRERDEVASPPVSVFMTVRNEERHLRTCVARILAQEYDGELELVVAVGPSADRTLQIARGLEQEYDGLTVVENPTGLTPNGLNAAVAAARHGILVRADGHALFPDGYVAHVVRVLGETGAANVGGRMQPEGTTPFGRAAARAMSSPFGIGGAAFHTGGRSGPQPTVYLGAFRRAPFERVGGYDEYFARAQDWELNHRLREAGETVWFEPDLAVVYHPRESLRSFASQQYRTGGWRRRVMRRHPESASARYLAPPAMVVTCALGVAVGLAGTVTHPGLLAGFAVPVVYLAGVSAVAWVDGRRLDPAARRRLPLAMAAMHLSWGAGFLRKA